MGEATMVLGTTDIQGPPGPQPEWGVPAGLGSGGADVTGGVL